MSSLGIIVGNAPVSSPAPELLRIFSGLHMGYKNIDLKQIDWQLFLQQRWVYSGLTENCNSVYNHDQPQASPSTARKGYTFIDRKRKLGRQEQKFHGFSLAELFP